MTVAWLHRWYRGHAAFWERLLSRDQPVSGPLRLDRRRIYILPTRSGVLFTVVLFAMLIGAINYNNSLAYALTFLLSSVALVSILHTFRNLHGLIFYVGHPAEVFAGHTVHFPLAIENRNSERLAIAVHFKQGELVVTDVGPEETHWIELHFPSERRGWLPLPRLTVSTVYPLGLFRAWSYLHFDLRALIYPVPAAKQHLPLPLEEGSSGGDLGVGSEDFAQLRPYHPGDSLRHVHWKAYAHEAGLLIKQFGAAHSPELWLSWSATTGHDSETRLSQLCRWVLDAEAAGVAYGLLLPGQRIEPANGEAHRRHCLKLLALFGGEQHHE